MKAISSTSILVVFVLAISIMGCESVVDQVHDSSTLESQEQSIKCPENGFVLNIDTDNVSSRESFVGAELTVSQDVAYADGEYVFDVVIPITGNEDENGLGLIWHMDVIEAGLFNSPYAFLVYDGNRQLLTHDSAVNDGSVFSLEITEISGPGSSIKGMAQGAFMNHGQNALISFSGEFCLDWN